MAHFHAGAEILINSVQRSDSSRYGILAQAGTVIHNFEMGVGVGLLVLALPGLLGAFFPHGFAFELDHIGVVDQPIQNGVGECGFINIAMPVFGWQL